ncbi:MAG: cytochrome b N-terminal domain-containing protein [Polyangiaceae bacterium]
MKLFDWLDDRTGYRDFMHEALDEPIPGGARWAYVWGSALTLTLIIQAVTGVLLMTAYAPSATTAWSSVMYIQHQMSAGWIVRGLHHFGAQAMVVLLAMHLGQTAIYGAYKKPREMNWFFGLGLMGLTLGFALTGYLLPWDQKGYWATKVATNIAGSLPLIGAWTQELLVGGADYGHLTLSRFYALHVAVLPIGTLVLLTLHIAMFRRHGVTPPTSANIKHVDRFYPKQVALDLAIGLSIFIILGYLSYQFHGAPLDGPADPASDYPARPEWYFLALFEALKFVPGQIEWVVAGGIPLLLGGYLVALPFIDRGPSTALRPRLKYLAPLGIVGLLSVGLTYSSISSDKKDPSFGKAIERAEKQAARAVTLAKRGVPPDGPLAMLARDPHTAGPALFEKLCASCHRMGDMGPEKGKNTAADLTDFGRAAWVIRVLDNPDDPMMFGRTPFKGMMPSFTRPPADKEEAEYFTKITPADQKAVVDFLVAQAHGKADKGSKGEEIVSLRCTSCHRVDGETDDDESLAPELRGWASRAWIEAQIRNPGSGKTYPAEAMDDKLEGHMPGFADQLSDDQIKLIAQWMSDLITDAPK